MDPEKAAHWVRLAAEQGHKQAQFNLGLMYEDGIGVQKIMRKLERWYRQSCPSCDVQTQKR